MEVESDEGNRRDLEVSRLIDTEPEETPKPKRVYHNTLHRTGRHSSDGKILS